MVTYMYCNLHGRRLYFELHYIVSIISKYCKGNIDIVNLKKCTKVVILNVCGPLAQSAERGADNAKVVSSTLTRINIFFLNWNTLS